MDVLPRPADPRRRPHSPERAGMVQLIVGVSLLTIVVIVDRSVSTRSMAAELPPQTHGAHLLRTAGLALASVAIVLGGRRLVTSRLRPRPHPRSTQRRVLPLALTGAVPAVVASVLLVADPNALSWLVREDRAVEWGSAGLAFVAAALFGKSALDRWRVVVPGRSGPAVPILLMAAGTCLLLGLEEISWFQRVLGVESPQFMIDRNGQQELNLHNLATGVTGNAYFVGGFVACTLVPFLVGDRRLPGPLARLQDLVPSRVVLLATATSAGIVYEMWNIVWIQLTFWMTLVALVILAGDGAADRHTRRVSAAVATVTVVAAAVHLALGDAMVRSWDDTEVRELVIPFGLVVAAIEVQVTGTVAARHHGR